ncbi:MAG: flagellin [Campylobacterota bacterium]|nr:flagellin [Campylobacterota bacterium]
MGFRINTNIAAMNAHRNSVQTNIGLDKSLESLSSGLRINTAADDASGMSIANQLRAQSTGLGQAINNANDGIGVTQTADGALDEYENIINTVRTKSIQAASDGQNNESRVALQRDISKLLEEAQNIATTTSFNGQQLLDGTFTDKAFHIGAYADEIVGISIGNAQINSIGAFAEVTGDNVTGGTTGVAVSVNGTTAAESTADTASGANTTAHSAGSAWAMAKEINAIAATTGVTATAETEVTSAAVVAGTFATGTTINGIDLGEVGVSANDSDGALTNRINSLSNQTGVTAVNDGGKIVLTSNDGSDIAFGGTDNSAILDLADGSTVNGGKLTFTSDTAITLTTQAGAGTTAGTTSTANALNSIDVTTRDNAEKAIKTTDAALRNVDAIRSNIGSTQNQLESTIRNISVTQVNVAAAESQIRDVDFAAESANFAKFNILAQSGSYAMSQANAVQQNVMRLLQ